MAFLKKNKTSILTRNPCLESQVLRFLMLHEGQKIEDPTYVLIDPTFLRKRWWYFIFIQYELTRPPNILYF